MGWRVRRDFLLDGVFTSPQPLVLSLLSAYWLFASGMGLAVFGWSSTIACVAGSGILLFSAYLGALIWRTARLYARHNPGWQWLAAVLAIPTGCLCAASLILPLLTALILVVQFLIAGLIALAWLMV